MFSVLLTVNISGMNLLGYGNSVTSVMFGAQAVDIIDVSNSVISVRINSSRNNNAVEPVNVTIISDTSAIVSSASDAWSFLIEGQITDVTPREGQSGTFVTLTGTNLLGNGTGITSVYLDGVAADVQPNFNSTAVRVRISTNIVRRMQFIPGEVRILANTGAIVTAAPNVNFTVREAGLITGFTPRSGREGTYITINGINLHGFGSEIINATVAGIPVMPNSIQFNISNPNTVTVRAGASNTVTSGNVELFINTGPIVLSNTSYNFIYIAPGNITMVTPSSGVEGVGVLITGEELYVTNSSLVDVSLAGASVSRVVVGTQSVIAVIAGTPLTSAPSSMEVLITASDGSVTRGSSFTYDPPHQISITPTFGQFGTIVNVTIPMTFDVSGGGLSVLVDNVPATVISSDPIVAISIPRALRQGSYSVDIVIENAIGELARLIDGFTYLAEGVIIDVTPDRGQRGTVVTVTGHRLLGRGSSIVMATLAGLTTRIMNSSNSTVTLEVLTNVNSTVSVVGDVVLTADSGAIVRQQRAWTAVAPSMISTVQPANGQLGTIVNISGVNLLQDGLDVHTISLAGIEVYNILNVSSTAIIVRASNASAGLTGPVRVVLSTGAYYESATNWIYATPTTISRIFPQIGAVGSTITIQLANFIPENITMVTINNTSAPILSVITDSVSVTVPTGNYSLEAVTIVVVTASGLIATQDDAFTVEALGNITSVTPRIIQQGIEVTISGVNLLGVSNQTAVQTVWLAGVLANQIIFYNSSLVIVEAGYNSTNVSGNIRISLNTSATIEGNLNTTIVSYYRAEIFSVTPSSGYNATRFNISGVNLIQPNSSLDSVMIGDINATVEQYNYNYIIARAGEPNMSDVNDSLSISVLSQSGALIESRDGDGWTYNTIPLITGIIPNMTAAGNNVTIYGTDLPVDNSSMILIGGIRAELLDFNETHIEAQLSFSIGNSEPQRVEIINTDGTVVTSDPIFSYDETVDNSIISVTPPAGLNGTTVTIVVNNTFNITSVYLANVMASNITMSINTTVMTSNTTNTTITRNITTTTITVIAGYGDDVTGDVLINTTTGLIGLQDGWRYLPVLSASQVSPSRGQEGTEVTITVGPSVLEDFNVTSVSLAGVNATILDVTDTAVLVEVGEMASATSLSDVVLYFEDGITLPIPQSWSYLPPINVTMVSNNAIGYYGTVVTIYGISFLNGQRPGVVNITDVLLANYIAVTVMSYNDTMIVCNISQFVDSSQEPIVGPIIVTNSLGFSINTSSGGIRFTYVQVDVTSVSPNRGQNGTLVTIRGVGLLAGAANITRLWLNSVLVRSIVSANDTVIMAQADYSNERTPLGNITYLTNTGAMGIIPQAWYYVAPATVSSISPISGTEGTVVTIRGTELLAGASSGVGSVEAVYLDGVAVSTVLIAFSDVIQVAVGYENNPDTMPGAITVCLSTGASWTSSNAMFTHVEPGIITMVTPLQGQNGTVINITGTSLYPPGDTVMSVTLAGVSARIITYTSSFIQVIAARPATLELFTGPVVIQASSGAIVRYTTNFTYLQEGIIFSVTPSQGQNGTLVKIEGQDLFGGGNTLDMVWLAGTAASIQSGSDPSCVMVTALENPSSNNDDITGDIVIISDTGAHVRRINGWQYTQRGVIDNVTPANGQYGTIITISGMRLLSGAMGISQVTIGGVTVDNIIGNDSVITGNVGNPGTNSAFNGTVSIISNEGGTLMSNYTWTYNQGGVISNFTPTTGGNNEIINITGTNLLGSGTRIVAAEVAGVTTTNILSPMNDTFIMIESEAIRTQDTFIGPIVLIANTGARVESSDNYTFTSPCNSSQFINITNGIIECIECNSLCESCSGPTDRDCLQCSPTTFQAQSTGNETVQCVTECVFATADRQCVGLCGAGQYENVSIVENVTFCFDCNVMCAPNTGCSGPDATECEQCRYVEYDSECVERCPQDTYGVQNITCLQCHEECNECTGLTSRDCVNCMNFELMENSGIPICVNQCPSNYYINGSTCLPCDPECLGGCTGSGPLRCQECRTATMMRLNNVTQCVSDCNIATGNIYYLNSTTGICNGCSELCSPVDGCEGPTASECITCRNGTYRYSNRTCIRDCSSLTDSNGTQYYNDDVTRTCELCDPSCGTRGCRGDPSNCIAASTGDSDEETDTFEAGVGTIAIVIIICAALLLMVLACLVILVIQHRRRKGKYEYPQAATVEDTEMSRYTDFTENRETKFSKPVDKTGASNTTNAATIKPPIALPTADDMYTDMSGTEDSMKRPLTGPKPADDQPIELYIDVPNTPQAAAPEDVGGEEYVDVPTPSATAISNPGYDDSDAVYEDTDQAIEAAKAYVRLQKQAPAPPPSLPPSRSKPSIPTPANPLQHSLSRLEASQKQPQPEAIYEEGPIEEQLYDAIGGAPEPPPPFKPKPPSATTSASNMLPLPPK